MTDSESQDRPPFPLVRSLVHASLVAVVVLGAALAVCGLLAAPRGAVAAVTFGVLLVGALYGLSFVVIALLAPHGTMPLLYGCFGLMGLRMFGVLVIASVVMDGRSWPGPPLAAALAASYLPLLALEVGHVVRHVHRSQVGSEVAAT